MDDSRLEERLAALESRLVRIESLLATANLEAAQASIQEWVTQYVSLRLQQLVPETCAHAPEEDRSAAEGPVLPGTRIRCSEDVIHRLGRIPIPFVRQMVAQRVADAARAEKIAVVDVAFFERAATF